MGILDTLLSLLGLSNSSSDDGRRETTVSVEREANTETEAAVKGADEAGTAGTDAPASTESLVDGTGEAAEPAEAVGPAGGETEPDTAEAGAEGETTGEHEATVDVEDAEAAAETVGTESVEVIKGIGPAYAERLSNAGVHSVADLAAADAAVLAEAVDLSETRVGRWIERAQDR
jgi:predicted flap endonuclease-1-like 5' DNA nuclease